MKKGFLITSIVSFLCFLPCVFAQEGYLEPFYWWARTSSPDVLFFKVVITIVGMFLINKGLKAIDFESWVSAIFSLAFGMAVLRFLPDYLVIPFTDEAVFGAIMIVVGVIIIWYFLSRALPLRQNRGYILIYAFVYGGLWYLFSSYSPYFMWSNPLLIRLSDFFRYGYYWNFRWLWTAAIVVVLVYIFWAVSGGRREETH